MLHNVLIIMNRSLKGCFIGSNFDIEIAEQINF